MQHYLYDVPVNSEQRRVCTGVARQNAGYLMTGVGVCRPATVREKHTAAKYRSPGSSAN